MQVSGCQASRSGVGFDEEDERGDGVVVSQEVGRICEGTIYLSFG